MLTPDRFLIEFEEFVDFQNNYCEHCINRATGKLDTEISEVVYYLTENYNRHPSMVNKTIIEKIDAFFKSIVASLKRFAQEIERKIEQTVRTKAIKYQFRNLAKTIEQKKREGVTSIEMIDVWELEKKTTKYYNELYDMGKSILKGKYKHLDKMDADFKDFDRKFDMYSKELDKLSEEKIKVPIGKAARWAESEVSGRNNTVHQMNDYINRIEDMEAEVLRMEDLRNIHGADILPHKMGIIRKIVTSLSNLIHNTIGKLVKKVIPVVVLFFA